MSDKFIENVYVILYAMSDMWDTFKKIVFLICSAFCIWFVYTNTNVMVTLCVFILIPVLVGTIWARLYKDAFRKGAVKIEDIENKHKEDK